MYRGRNLQGCSAYTAHKAASSSRLSNVEVSMSMRQWRRVPARIARGSRLGHVVVLVVGQKGRVSDVLSVALKPQSREDVYRGRKQGCSAYTAKKVAEFEMSMSMREYGAGIPARIAGGIRARRVVVSVVGRDGSVMLVVRCRDSL